MDANRIVEIGGREATLLSGDNIRVVVSDKGGMVPELSFPNRNGWLNTHWNPHFRSNSGQPYDPGRDESFWTAELLYELAGNFPCLPSFGDPCSAYGEQLAAHGTTANTKWRPEKWGLLEDMAFAKSTIDPSVSSLDLAYTKYDIIESDHPGLYTYLKVRNAGERSLRINLGWHNTVGPPFLAPGCLIDVSADRFATTPTPTDFQSSGMLEPGAQFDSLEKAPLTDGGAEGIRRVPGMIGRTDFVTGAVPNEADLGWSSVVNPSIGAIYLTLFPGPGTSRADEIPIYFNDLWMQYGGRDFTPWAAFTGGVDSTFCLGTENATGAFANGLEYSLEHPELLGWPTTFELSPGAEAANVYATFTLGYDGGVLDQGVSNLTGTNSMINVEPRVGNRSGSFSFTGDPSFELLRARVALIENET